MIEVNPTITCPYCGNECQLVNGKKIYGRDAPLHQVLRNFYLCEPCKAYVGVHKGTTIAYGTPAKRELRWKRKSLHSHFDRLWRDPRIARQLAYFWLSRKMGLPLEETHIGMFDEKQCDMALEHIRHQEIDSLL